MVYTDLVKKALNLAYEGHQGIMDKAGVPYIFHPFSVALMMTTEEETVTALLHDVVEDTEITLQDLRTEGFPDEVVKAVALLTHDEAVPYRDYIVAVSKNEIARKVKLADLTHNLDDDRHTPMTEYLAQKRENVYRPALRFLKNYKLHPEYADDIRG